MQSAESASTQATYSRSTESIKAAGLTLEEYDRVVAIMEREPNDVELGIFGVMWSEHCSYKTTKIHLMKLPTTGKQVICGPGENAGVVDIGDNQAAIFKIESHNHPSFIEPFQGAATGVGGILRDVFTMGARPIALLNALSFGAPNHPRTRHLLKGVVSGIGFYGNCVGVPTVGGETRFDAAYNGNILVNAMCVGLADADNIFYSKAAGVGNPVVYVGAKTGRDGIHGAVMASAEFDDDTEERRPTVQVGDPFTEKLLIEACLELMATDAIIAIQDMGAAGMTCSSLEMADKGGLGIDINLDDVPQREPNMTAYEIMLSESQERMLMVLKPERIEQAKAIFDKWDLSYAVVGSLTDTGRMRLYQGGELVGDMPVAPISGSAPMYERPYVATPTPAPLAADAYSKDRDIGAVLTQLIGSPALASKAWIYSQYDHMVMNDTVLRPGSDAAILRVHGTQKGLAVSTDVNPHYCLANPQMGGKQAVAEAYRNLSAVGALPLATTNCLNFGNPEKPEIMGQIAYCLQGMGEACSALDMPIVSGNVSLYNETHGNPILPTPTIGGVGLLTDLSKRCDMHISEAGHSIYVLGNTQGHLGASLFLRDIEGVSAGDAPSVDLAAEKLHGTFVRSMIAYGRIHACHDVSEGGLLCALTEMTLRHGVGAEITLPADVCPTAFCFGEDQARYVLVVPQEHQDAFMLAANELELPITYLGKTGGEFLSVAGHTRIAVEHLRAVNQAWFAGYME
jgi:phosphoribosylformylglycinamidine synthase subunit PurL